MRELEARISAARTRLTELQQEARQGQQAQALVGLLILSGELVGQVLEQTGARPPRRSHELDGRIWEARTRLTELQQDARQGRRAQMLVGLLALASELMGYVLEQSGKQLSGPR